MTSLGSALSNLFSPLFARASTPAIPKTSAPVIGVSSPSALGIRTPAIPKTTAQISAINAANPHTGANASYVSPANATASKGTVPYVPSTSLGGGMSVVPTSTSAKTGLPSSNVPGSISPVSSRGKTPIMPAMPSISSTPKTTTTTTRTASLASPSFDTTSTDPSSTSTPTSPDLSALDAGGAGGSLFGSGGASTAGAGGFTMGGMSGVGAMPTAWNSLAGGGTDPNSTDPYGLSYFYSKEQQNAEKAYQDSLKMTPQEEAAMKQLNNLNTSFQSAYTNAQGQAIPLPFITGQQAQLQRSQSALATPLEGAISLLQAKRQLAGTSAKTALDQANNRLSTFEDWMKPVPTSYGGTLSQFDPKTGTYKTLVNPFGTATGTATGSDSGDVSTQIGSAIANGQITQDMVTRYGIPFIAATLKADPGYNFITQKASVAANSASLKTQQAYVDTVTRSFNAANENLSSLIGFMNSSGINTSSTVPIINELQNKVKAGVTDAGTIAAFQASLQGLRSEYAQVLSRGGEVTDSARSSAKSLIPDNLTPAQLQQVASRLNVEGQNAIAAATQQVQTIVGRTGSNTGSSNFGTSGGGANPFSASNFFGS